LLFAMLSLRRERIEDLDDEEARPMTRADEITVEDAFPADEGEPDGGRTGVSAPRGLAIAAAWFAPTFVAVFLGLPYLLGSAGPSPSPAVPPSETAGPLAEGPAPTQPGASPWDPLRALLGGPSPGGLEPPAEDLSPGLTPGPRPPASSSDEGSAPAGASESADLAPPAAGEQGPPAAVTLPPPAPRASEAPQSAESSRVAGPSHPARESRPAPDAAPAARTRPSRPAGSDRGDWMPAAAFTGREAASRLAASIERQGYPVQVRRDGSGARPWVVWIGSQPNGGHR
jgi:hypothetical protein